MEIVLFTRPDCICKTIARRLRQWNIKFDEREIVDDKDTPRIYINGDIYQFDEINTRDKLANIFETYKHKRPILPPKSSRKPELPELSEDDETWIDNKMKQLIQTGDPTTLLETLGRGEVRALMLGIRVGYHSAAIKVTQSLRSPEGDRLAMEIDKYMKLD